MVGIINDKYFHQDCYLRNIIVQGDAVKYACKLLLSHNLTKTHKHRTYLSLIILIESRDFLQWHSIIKIKKYLQIMWEMLTRLDCKNRVVVQVSTIVGGIGWCSNFGWVGVAWPMVDQCSPRFCRSRFWQIERDRLDITENLHQPSAPTASKKTGQKSDTPNR